MRSFQQKFPKLFSRSPSKQLERVVQTTKKQANTLADDYEQVLINVLNKLWKTSEQSPEHLESETKSIIDRLENGLNKAEYDPSALLRGIVTIHRLLLEGPEGVYEYSCLRTNLQLLLQVSEREFSIQSLSSTKDELQSHLTESRSKRISLIAAQYAALLKEKLDILRDFGSVIGGDWCPVSHMHHSNLYIFDFLEQRPTLTESLKAVDSESPGITRLETNTSVPSAITLLKRLSTYGQSLAMLLSRLTALLSGELIVADVKECLFSVIILEARFLIRLFSTMITSAILLQVVPHCDEERYHEFIKKYPSEYGDMHIDDQILWKNLRSSSEDCRFRLLRKLTTVVDKELCVCQYHLVGGESWLLRCLVLVLRTDVIPFYFPHLQEPLLNNTVQEAYMSLLRLTTCTARESFRKLPEVRDLFDQLLQLDESVVEAVQGARGSASIAAKYQVIQPMTGTPVKWGNVGLGLMKSLKQDFVGFSERETENRMLSNYPFDTLPLRVSCDFDNIPICTQLPLVGLDPSSTRRKWWRRRRVESKSYASHRIVDPLLFPDKRLLETAFMETQTFLLSVRNAQRVLVEDQRRRVELRQRHIVAKLADSPSRETTAVRSHTSPFKRGREPNSSSRRSNSRHRQNSASRSSHKSLSLTPRSLSRHRQPRSGSRTPLTPRSPSSLAPKPTSQIITQNVPTHYRVLSDTASLTSRSHGFTGLAEQPTRTRSTNVILAPSPLATMAGLPTQSNTGFRAQTSIEFQAQRSSGFLVPQGTGFQTQTSAGYTPQISTGLPIHTNTGLRIQTKTVFPALTRSGTQTSSLTPFLRAATPPRRTRTHLLRHDPPNGTMIPWNRTQGLCIKDDRSQAPAVARLKQPLTEASELSTSLLASYEIRAEEVNIIEKVGRGATATVYKGTWQGTEVAIKMFKEKSVEQNRSEVIQELLILFKVRHPNLVLIMGTLLNRVPSIDGTTYWPKAFVSEFCAGGTLFSLLHRKQSFVLTWSQRIKIARDVAQGCCYLHTFHPPIVHRDLKSLNILLTHIIATSDENPQAKISDFGMSAWKRASSSTGSSLLHGMAGTYHWMAPEVVLGQSYRESVDIYSYGIILYELCSETLPYEELSYLEPQVIGRLVAIEGRRPDVSKVRHDCPREMRELMTQCWTQDPKHRPTFHYIIAKLDCLRR